MSTSIAETSEIGSLPSTRPEDLDDAYMDAGSAPLWPIFQQLVNRSAAMRDMSLGYLSWSGDMAVAPGGAANNFTVTLGAINAVLLYTGSVYKVFAYAGGTITQTKVEGGGGTLGASAKWWYVYAFVNGSGQLDFEVSDTAPNASRTLKSGDNTRRYLGCFVTDSSGAPIPARASRGRYTYQFSATSGATLRVLNSGTATSWADVACSAWVPPHARVAQFKLDYAAGGTPVAEVRTKGDTSGSLDVRTSNATLARMHVEMITDSSQRIQYQVGSGDLSVYVLGFSE